MDKHIEKLIFASRWLQAPLYLGLIATLVALGIKFFLEMIHLFASVASHTEAQLILIVLSLVDLVMVANLIVMVVISGYENFVSKIDIAEATDKLSWFGKLDSGSLKIKLAVSIIAISAIHLLKTFLNYTEISSERLLVLVVVHMTFVASALGLALLDRMTGYKPAVVERAGTTPETA
jgi:uncharacterized protein (TIGR00645 family)